MDRYSESVYRFERVSNGSPLNLLYPSDITTAIECIKEHQEIVRCKDCHYAKDDTEFCQKHHYVYCSYEGDNTCRNYNDFCSYGERKLTKEAL